MARPPTKGQTTRSGVDQVAPPRPRGRPRSSGEHQCDRCHRPVAKIRVRWPDGAICGICFTEAMRTRGRCCMCGQERLLPGRDHNNTPICRDCAGITHPDMTCTQCGTETERFRAGACIRCVLEHDLTQILKPTSPPDLRLKRLIQILTSTERPESIYTWMRGKTANQLLTRIGLRQLDLTPDALNTLPYSPAVEHLREILIHHHLMAGTTDRHLAIFERWVRERLDQLSPHPEVSSTIDQYTTWHHLSRLRKRVGHANMDIACRNARQQITEAGKFLLWIKARTGIITVTQAHIDEYLSTGTGTRYHIKNFITWYTRSRGPANLHVPARHAKAVPTQSPTQRLQIIRNTLEFENVTLSTRIAALINLLWATPLTRIVRLTTEHIQTHPTGMEILLGITPTQIPEPLTEMFWTHLSDRTNQHTTNTHTNWLFPGYRAGQHLTVPTLQQRLRTLGLEPQRTRNATLDNLTSHIDARTLADTLGYAPKTLTRHAQQASGRMQPHPQHT